MNAVAEENHHGRITDPTTPVTKDYFLKLVAGQDNGNDYFDDHQLHLLLYIYVPSGNYFSLFAISADIDGQPASSKKRSKKGKISGDSAHQLEEIPDESLGGRVFRTPASGSLKPPHSGSKKFNNSPIPFPKLLESPTPNNTGTGTEFNYSPIPMLKESPTPNKARTRRTK